MMARTAEPTTDLGPVIRRHRGDVVVEERAADPDAPNRTIRRARLADPVRRMLVAGEITIAQWGAAERYRDDDAIADGAREAASASGGLAPWQRAHFTDRQLDACRARALALTAVGARCGFVFLAVVAGYQGLRETERDLGMRNGTAGDVVKEALERLSAHYAETD